MSEQRPLRVPLIFQEEHQEELRELITQAHTAGFVAGMRDTFGKALLMGICGGIVCGVLLQMWLKL